MAETMQPYLVLLILVIVQAINIWISKQSKDSAEGAKKAAETTETKLNGGLQRTIMEMVAAELRRRGQPNGLPPQG